MGARDRRARASRSALTLLALLRHGLLLSLGWIVAAALALRHHGFLWALLLVVLWAALIVLFQRATVAHAQAIARKSGGKST